MGDRAERDVDLDVWAISRADLDKLRRTGDACLSALLEDGMRQAASATGARCSSRPINADGGLGVGRRSQLSALRDGVEHRKTFIGNLYKYNFNNQ